MDADQYPDGPPFEESHGNEPGTEQRCQRDQCGSIMPNEAVP